MSKGPKKREGKGWIIESCTTSGAPSDAEMEPENESGEVEERTMVLDVFGGDSDLTDIDSDEDTAELEYDLGLTGLPPVPVSSDEEWDPSGEAGAKEKGADGEARPKRYMRRTSTLKKRGVDFGGAFPCAINLSFPSN